MQISLDFAARKVIMASMLYYGLEESVLSDHVYDGLCERVAREWDDLTPQRRFSLRSSEEIRATGYRVRISTLAECAALSWLIELGRYDPEGPRKVVHTSPQKYSQVIGRWRPAASYRWEQTV